MYSPGMFTTSQCQNFIGPTYKTNLDKLFLMPKNYFCLFVLFIARETHNFYTSFNKNSKEKTLSSYRRKMQMQCKMPSSKNIYLYRDFPWQVFFCLRPPPFLGFCLEWSSNFVGSETGQIQNIKLLQNMGSKKTQHPQPLPSQTLSAIYITVL
jgi:hypothetical protein